MAEDLVDYDPHIGRAVEETDCEPARQQRARGVEDFVHDNVYQGLVIGRSDKIDRGLGVRIAGGSVAPSAVNRMPTEGVMILSPETEGREQEAEKDASPPGFGMRQLFGAWRRAVKVAGLLK